ncbi:S8 family serine peptidase [Streptococcus catagoni]|uniref:S8 family serine peptidase n=1 Tax=Streptococcus catagoni TaxID=2654874 RepID=UPI00140E6492|nr:S8 family serine peptidase [Streptococcus catagoni]
MKNLSIGIRARLQITNDRSLKNKVVVFERGEGSVYTQILDLMKKDVKGIILINTATPSTLGNYQTIPEIRSSLLDDDNLFKKTWAVSVSYKDGQVLKELIQTKSKEKVTFGREAKLTKVFDHIGIPGFSSWGSSPNLEIKPDIVAPGENIWSTANANAYFNLSGTSMASPYVVGASARLLLGYYRRFKALLTKEKDLLKHNRVIDLTKLMMQNTADVLKDHTVAKGKAILDYSP